MKKGIVVSLGTYSRLSLHSRSLDAAFVPWSTDLYSHLLTRFPLPPGTDLIPEGVLLEPKWTLAFHHHMTSDSAAHVTNDGPDAPAQVNGGIGQTFESDLLHSGNRDKMSDSEALQMTVTLDENRRLTPDTHWQDVRHLTLTGDAPAAYGPGDVLIIHPKNSSREVDQLIRCMNWVDVADRAIKFHFMKRLNNSSFYSPPPISLSPTGTTFRMLLTDHLDLTAIPRRSFFSLIAHFTDDQFHKDRLVELTKPEYIDELYDYTTRPRRSILEVLQEFDSVKIPWQWAANVLPELRGRQFSIASGGQLKTTQQGNARFELLVAIVRYSTVIKKTREGVCTRYLAALPVGTELRVGLQKGGLAITKAEAGRPVLMVGPGTGIAPMRSLVRERLQWLEETRASHGAKLNGRSNGIRVTARDILIFGCRNQSADYFYREEWKGLMEQMPLAVYTAFSRDQDRKIYVQDVIRQEAFSVYRLLWELGGMIYVCGSSGKMPHAVRDALVDVFRIQGNIGQVAAETYLESMEKEGRYKQETW